MCVCVFPFVVAEINLVDHSEGVSCCFFFVVVVARLNSGGGSSCDVSHPWRLALSVPLRLGRRSRGPWQRRPACDHVSVYVCVSVFVYAGVQRGARRLGGGSQVAVAMYGAAAADVGVVWPHANPHRCTDNLHFTPLPRLLSLAPAREMLLTSLARRRNFSNCNSFRPFLLYMGLNYFQLKFYFWTTPVQLNNEYTHCVCGQVTKI